MRDEEGHVVSQYRNSMRSKSTIYIEVNCAKIYYIVTKMYSY